MLGDLAKVREVAWVEKSDEDISAVEKDWVYHHSTPQTLRR